ncbi:hypothetical protein ACERC8_06545 [Streptococcus sp. E29BA]|uniref:hypothetical protein n=1 Tax=Streptococcus sp. E29BA TaxID=3278716 RepID=UPI00359CE2D2
MTYSYVRSPLSIYYASIAPIVDEFESLYSKQVWLVGDWALEGQQVLTLLLKERPDLGRDLTSLKPIFKEKFLQRLDRVRSYQP